MYKIVNREQLAKNICLMDIYAPRIAESANPGQFVIVIADEYSERIPLTICDYDKENGTVQIVIQATGDSSEKICNFKAGEYFRDFVGPLGRPSELINMSDDDIKNKKFLFVAGGVGTAPIYPQVKYLNSRGIKPDVIIGARSKEFIILEEKIKKCANNLYITTDDGSYGMHGRVTDKIIDLIENEDKHYDHCIAIGPMIMMKFTCLTTKKYNLQTTVSLNPIMVDGTGMCGACRVKIGNEVKFACVDGPEFDGHLVDFDSAIKRQQQFKNKTYVEEPHDHICTFDKAIAKQHQELAEEKKNEKLEIKKAKDRFKRIPVREQAPNIRNKNFEEVCYGYTPQEAILEASRCLNCKNPRCITGCPVNIDIPGFVKHISEGKFEDAAKKLANYTALPAICGRVCPQESQCEANCILGIRGEALSIGKLERFTADYARQNNLKLINKAKPNGHKVAIIGAGPAGLTCAGELAKLGYKVTIFEALHQAAGVLVYGIPEFRLPDEVVQHEVDNLIELGVEIKTDIVVGRTLTIDDILNQGYEAIFIGSGAGLPRFMGIPGEELNGVYSANEFLTRNNLMRAFDKKFDTPLVVGKTVAVIGGGNVAMDAARVAKRLGADVSILYRRTEDELPARAEEVHHAKEEGIKFEFLTSPEEIIGDDNGWVKSIKCIRNELGAPDSSGRRRPQKIAGSDFTQNFETVIMALGTTPNPLIAHTTNGLEINKWGCIVTNEETGQTSREGIYAGGDAVTGAATVILAMGAGKNTAKHIDNYIKSKNK